MKLFSRLALALSILLCLVSPVQAAAERTYTLYPATDTTATGQGVITQDTTGFAFMSCAVNFTASSGSLTALNVYIQGSYDAGTSWVDLTTNTAQKLTATVTAAGTAATLVGKREIVAETAIVASGNLYWGLYNPGLPPLIRAAWGITPTSTPHETFSVICTLKD